MSRLIARHPLAAFLLLAYGWTWGLALPLLLHRRGLLAADVGEGWEAVSAFGPFVAAVVVLGCAGGRSAVTGLLHSLGRWRVGAGGLLLGCASPFLLLALAVIVTGAATGQWPSAASLGAGRLATAAGWAQLVVVAGLVQGLGEEPGWRGLLLPRLRERHGPLAATLVLFPAWLLWHLPAFLGRPEFGVAQFAAFSLGILAAAVWLTLVMERTGSVLMAAAWHAFINIARGMALAVSTPLFLALSTLILLGAVAIAGYWLLAARRRRVPGPASRRD